MPNKKPDPDEPVGYQPKPVSPGSPDPEPAEGTISPADDVVDEDEDDSSSDE